MFKGVNEGGKRQDVGIRRTKVRRSGGGEDLRGGLPAVRGAGGTVEGQEGQEGFHLL